MLLEDAYTVCEMAAALRLAVPPRKWVDSLTAEDDLQGFSGIM